MKRLLMFMLVWMLAVGGVSASTESAPRTGADLSYDRIVEMALTMRQLVMGDYLQIKQVPQAQQDVARTWAKGVNETPRLVVQVNIDQWAPVQSVRLAYSQEDPMVQLEAESTLVAELWQMLAYTAAQEASVMESGYEEIMVINSHINARMMYAEDGREGNAAYIVLYEDAAPLFMIANAENGAVSIQGMFLPSGNLRKCANYGQISLWMMLNGVAMTCQEILPD